jgi:hypothetical protein
MKGVCFMFSETGTEGGWWAMQKDGFITEDGHWSYDGLEFLEKGMTSPCMPRTAACSFTTQSIRILKPRGFRVRYSARANW